MRVRGVNPLIATILLLLVSLAIAGLLYSWLAGYTTEQTAKATEQSEEDIELCRDASFRIVSCSAAGKDLRVKLESTGDVDLNGFIAVVRFNDGNVTRFVTDQNLLARSFLLFSKDLNSTKSVLEVKIYPTNCPEVGLTDVCND